MNDKPYISIVTCTLNSERYLPKCLESVENQNYRNFEHIFVDSHSQDSTIAIIREYINNNEDINVKLINTEPGCISSAMNAGIEASTGEVIHILHSDDYYYDNSALGKVTDYFEGQEESNWIIGNKNMLIKNKLVTVNNTKIYAKNPKLYLKMYDWIPHASTFMKKKLFDKYGLFDENLKLAMDYDYWFRIIDKETPLIVGEDLVVYRRHRNSTSLNLNTMLGLDKEVINIKSKYK